MKIVAYLERESCHPDTGAHGILRDEWRLIPYNSTNPIHVQCANQRNRAGRFTPTTILEHRYIRRGVIEPWQVFDGYESDDAALADITPKANSLDPRLTWIQHDRIRLAKEREAAKLEEYRAQQQREEESRLRALSHKAWSKLFNSPRYRPLCDEWNDMTTRPGARALRDQLINDSHFMALYDRACHQSITTTEKRVAMRECIDYYNFMWHYREPSQPPEVEDTEP